MNSETISKFFNTYIEPKWQPSVMEITDEGKLAERISVAILDIGERLVGNKFVLDDENVWIYHTVVKYLMGHDTGPVTTSKGLYIWGRVGCGKTTLLRVAGVFAKIFNKRNGYRIQHCHDCSSDFQLRGPESLNDSSGGSICYDELGSEPLTTSYYGTQVPVMAMHVDKRYRLWTTMGRWTHFTSNFDLKWVGENYGVREADRVREMCNVLKMPGGSRR